jgi:hypothetical protein
MLDTTAETNINRAPNQQHLPPSIWTEEKTAQFKDMHARNESYAVIAAALGPGFSRNAVAGRAYRLGLPKREPTARSVRIRRANDGGAMQQRITNKHLQKVKTLNQKTISGESWCVGCYPLVYLPPRPRAARAYHPLAVDPSSVTLNHEILTLTDRYAQFHGISRDTAANELLRIALGAAA